MMKSTVFGLLTIFILSAGCASSGSDEETAAELTEEQKEAYLQQGKAIATATFAELSGQLQVAMKEGGVPHAVRYCNTVAYPLVDSLSEVHNADIRRTSLLIRNPKDAPTTREREQLEAYASAKKAGDPLQPVVKAVSAEEIAFYAPISMQPLCLKCHGQLGETLAEEDYAVIKEKYPSDEAIGYQAGDLRGMWSITFARD